MPNISILDFFTQHTPKIFLKFCDCHSIGTYLIKYFVNDTCFSLRSKGDAWYNTSNLEGRFRKLKTEWFEVYKGLIKWSNWWGSGKVCSQNRYHSKNGKKGKKAFFLKTTLENL